MRISHEAIYQALYVQGRGALRRELTACLRTGRALRVPRARTRGRGKTFVTPEVMISQRPAEADDPAVPGHWEGDLIIGLNSSAIGTLVECTTRFTMLAAPAADRATTLANSRYMIEVHILPTFGDRPPASVTAEEIGNWERRIAASDYSRRTARDARSTFTTVLGDAIPRHIQANPSQRRRGRNGLCLRCPMKLLLRPGVTTPCLDYLQLADANWMLYENTTGTPCNRLAVGHD